MNQHQQKHSHDHQHGHEQHQGHHPSRRMKRHHIWMLAGVVLMLVAMAMYVLSLDESIAPGERLQESVPADAPAD